MTPSALRTILESLLAFALGAVLWGLWYLAFVAYE